MIGNARNYSRAITYQMVRTSIPRFPAIASNRMTRIDAAQQNVMRQDGPCRKSGKPVGRISEIMSCCKYKKAVCCGASRGVRPYRHFVLIDGGMAQVYAIFSF